jgi:N-acetylmuramoyl-L-alanine amidase
MKLSKKLFVVTLCFLMLSPAASASAADYKVASKDTLYSLSDLFDTNVKYLQNTNNFNVDSLTPGDEIFVPARVYKVRSGDSLFTIATKYGIPVSKLKRANWNTGNSIEPGEKLIIPGVKPSLKTDAVIRYSSGDVGLLAKLIEAEAAGESMQAKIAVGAVVVNRVQSGDWASTIRGVIYQKFGQYYQFTPVKIGTINNTPSAASKRAAWIAMYGSDPSNGAIYYFDQTSNNDWLWSKPLKARIDHMVFVK